MGSGAWLSGLFRRYRTGSYSPESDSRAGSGRGTPLVMTVIKLLLIPQGVKVNRSNPSLPSYSK